MRVARRVGFVWSLALLATAVSIATCGGDDDSSKSTPAGGASATAGGSTAAYPVEVTDLLGRKVQIKAKPNTVVALSPTAVELVYAAGGTVVGRSASVDFPEAAKAAKEVGTAYQPNLEAILALKPDLVVADSVIHAQPQLRKPLEDLGVPVVFAGADSYQKVLDGIALMGKVFNAGELTKKLSADIESAKADAKKALAGKQVSAVALIADRDQTLYAAKPSSYAGDVMNQLGLTNPAASQADSGPFPGYTTLAPEKLLEYNPDFIFTITPAPPPAPRLSALFPQIPPFKTLKAVTGKHVIEADVELFLQAPGPRVVLAFKAITAAVGGQQAGS
jgi:iron complex transport system substrate-binding protein